MKYSKLYAPTLREVPAEAEIISHQLMMRAGMLRKLAAGVYTYMPLADRVLKKISKIVREEMDDADGQEVALPIIQPAELWMESGRWDAYGDEMWRVKDRHNREFCLGPTHEEVMTDLVRNGVRSYKQLPLLLYQIQNKYRDERRPRFGLMRGREFVMKDLYSFDVDQAGLEKSYQNMYAAYENVFTRCGLTYRAVEADNGAIGGSESHEFMALADSGEAEIAYCDSCAYAANVEIAQAELNYKDLQEKEESLSEIETPGCKTIDDLAAFLKKSAKGLVKTLCYQAEDDFVVALLRGNDQISEIKLANLLQVKELEMADNDLIISKLGASPGSLGPVGLPADIRIVADNALVGMCNMVVGANKDGYHMLNANFDRDFKVDIFADLRLVEIGDQCPNCKGKLQKARGIEVGQVFKLGTKYSTAMKCTFLDAAGKEKPMVMGCYGIGVSRTMAAIIEQSYDENGIIWPMAVAPFEVNIVPVSDKDPEQVATAEKIYQNLKKNKIDVLLDDRKERAGVKFKDSELIGIPYMVVVGKGLKEGMVELKDRKTKTSENIAVEEISSMITEKVEAARG